MERKRSAYKFLIKIPFIGPLIQVANAYAYRGDPAHFRRLAPVEGWCSRILLKLLLVGGLAVALAVLHEGKALEVDIVGYILTVFPGMLGFGIGVFALMFTIPSAFLALMRSKREQFGFGPEIIPPDLAYPLVVMGVTIVAAVLYKYLPGTWFYWGLVFLFFYAMEMAFELLMFIFTSTSGYVLKSGVDDTKDKQQT